MLRISKKHWKTREFYQEVLMDGNFSLNESAGESKENILKDPIPRNQRANIEQILKDPIKFLGIKGDLIVAH
jgi:hypothetical protein